MSAALKWSRLVILLLLAGSACDRAETPVEEATVEPIKVGILHSQTGTLAISETAVIDATILAIEDVNEQGGLLGRMLKPIVVDGSSDESVFAREAARLLDEEQVAVIFGCWTSASRKAVRPIIEARDGLLFYPVQFEGLEQSPNIFYLGSSPNQQILPAVDWAMDELGARRFLLVGSDYVFPRAANAIITDYVQERGGEVVGEEYVGLGSTHVENLVQAAVETNPDVILNTINGDTNITFFRTLRESGIRSEEIPTISFSIGEPELRGMPASLVTGDYAAWNYFQSIAGKVNLSFVRRFGDRYHRRRVLSDPMQSAWNGVHLWAESVRRCGSINPSRIRAVLPEIQYEAPEGEIRVDGDTHYTWMRTRIGQITPSRFFNIVWESDSPVKPEPYPSSRSKEQWDSFLQDLYTRWGGRWSNPDAR